MGGDPIGNKSDLKDNYFWGRSSTDVIADLAAGVFTLAGISALQASEQKRIGWSDNPTILQLYSMTSAGVYIARTDASGLVTEANSASTKSVLTASRYSNLIQAPPSVIGGTLGEAYTDAIVLRHRIGHAEITLVGGALENTVLVPALAGYYGVVKIGKISSNTPDTYTLTFQDEDDAACTGLRGGVANVVVANADQYVDHLEGMVVYKATDNKALEVDVSGGAGVEVVQFDYEYWYET